jgi:hypothetical protein
MSLLRSSCLKTLQPLQHLLSHTPSTLTSAELLLLRPAYSAHPLLNAHSRLAAAPISGMDQPKTDQPETQSLVQQQQQQPDTLDCDGCDGAPELTPGLVPERGAAAGAAAPANPDCYACHDEKLPTAPPPGYSADSS